MNERIEFEISIGRLKAANLFTSTDPTRHAMAGVRVEVRHSGEVMLAATDGHRLACVKGQGLARQGPADDVASITIPRGLIASFRDSNKQLCTVSFPECGDAIAGRTRTVTLTVDGKSCTTECSAKEINDSFPGFRRVIQKPDDTGSRGAYVSSRLLGDFSKAIAMIYPGRKDLGMLISSQGNELSLIYIQDGALREFFGVIMPMIDPNDEKRRNTCPCAPDWINL